MVVYWHQSWVASADAGGLRHAAEHPIRWAAELMTARRGMIAGFLLLLVGSAASASDSACPEFNTARTAKQVRVALAAVGPSGERVRWCAPAAGESFGAGGILVEVPEGHPWSTCPSLIPATNGPHEDLRVIPAPDGPPLELVGFWRFDLQPPTTTGFRTGPTLFYGTHPSDLGQLVVCHHGEWLLAMVH